MGLSRRDDDWVVRVRNNGPGLDEDEAARLFASFGPDAEGATATAPPAWPSAAGSSSATGAPSGPSRSPAGAPTVCFTLPGRRRPATDPGAGAG